MSKRPTAARRDRVEVRTVELEAVSAAAPAASSRLFPWLLALFAASGCAALIYEIVWFQLLQLVIGSSAISLGLLLAAYMGGLCLGSAAFARFVPARLHPLRTYALIEAGIGLFGLIALFGVPLVGHLYVATAFSGFFGMIWRGVIAAACLIPPTLLMGAGYPAISRVARSNQLGFLYSANVAGAVIGCTLAGFWLLRVYDMAIATYAAVAINVAGALVAYAFVNRTKAPETPAPEAAPAVRARGAMVVYLAIGLSGLTALGAEVVWTRLLSLLLGPTVYTFSIILAVFLIGLFAGSSAGSFIARRVRDSRMALALCQILLAAGIAWTAVTVAKVLPYWPVDPWLSVSPWFNFDLDIERCVRAILPATLLWGASFPLALAAASAANEDQARLSGEVYAANTAGSIVGALAFSLFLIPALGTQGSEKLLIWLAAAAAIAALAAVYHVAGRLTSRLAAALAVTLVVSFVLSATVSGIPWQAIAYGRRIAPILRNVVVAGDTETKPLFVGEGVNSSVVITERGPVRAFYVSGKSEASNTLIDMRLQRMMGHLPALIHTQDPAPRTVLVVGFGAGVTAGSFVPYSGIGRINICELEPLIPRASGDAFSKENNNVLRDVRTHVVYDDARHYILTTPDKFDIITTDPIHPWVKGSSTLFSKEYFELVRSHLNAGGIAAQWLPLYESDDETIKTELATFFSVFPNATVWSNFIDGDGYDLVLLGSADPQHIFLNDLQNLLTGPGYGAVKQSLDEIGIRSVTDLAGTYAGRAQDLSSYISGAPVNMDLNMRLQYIAGLGVNSVAAPRIYRDILSFRRFPEDLFTGRGEAFDELRETMGRPRRIF